MKIKILKKKNKINTTRKRNLNSAHLVSSIILSCEILLDFKFTKEYSYYLFILAKKNKKDQFKISWEKNVIVDEEIKNTVTFENLYSKFERNYSKY